MRAVKLSIGTTEAGKRAVLIECDNDDDAQAVFDLVDEFLEERGVTIWDTRTDNN